MSFAKYLKAGSNPGMTRGRGYNMRGSYRGGDGEGGSWGGRGSRGRGNNYSGPTRGRSNWYKEHPGGFEQRGRYPSEGGGERYSGRGHIEEPGYRRYPRQETSGYSGREHGHHRSPEESPRKRMKTDHGYMQASSSRRSLEGSYSDYNRYSFTEDKGYGEERRSYRDDRRSYREHSHGEHGGYGSRDEYSHRKERLEADRGESSVMEARHPPLRGGYRGRGLERGRLRRVLRGPRVVLVRRADGLVLKKRSIVDHPYSVRKRLISARPQEYLKKLRTQKFRRLREAEGEEVDEEKEEDLISDEDDKEEENWDELEKVEDDDFDDFDDAVEEVKSVKEDKEENEKETNNKKKEEETEEKPKEVEEEEEEGEKETKKPETEKVEKATVQVTIKHDSDARAVNEDELAHLIPKHFIRLHCPHCNIRCITYKEYGVHLYSSKHANTMRKLAMKHKLSLQRMRFQQRKNQREEEEGDEEIGDVPMHSVYCPVCQLKYRTSREKHQASNLHRMLRKFLMPYCRVCNMSFQSPMQYENHVCSVVHMQRKWKMDQRILRQKELDLEGDHEGGSGMDGEDKDLDLENFMIVDSVGVVDETGDEVEGESGTPKEKLEKGKKEEEKKKEVRLGVEYIKKVEVLFCELCRRYLPRLDQPERAISLHCRTSLHLECYRDDRAMRREAERIHRKEMEKKKNDEILSKKAAKKTEASAEKSESGGKEEEPQTNDAEEKKTDEANESPKASGEAGTTDVETANEEPKQDSGEGGEAEDIDSAMDDKLWADVDKDLGELLREVEPTGSAAATEGENVPAVEIEEEKSSDEDEEDSRAEEEERYDRFRYSEKGGAGSVVEEPIPSTEAAVAKPEVEAEPTVEAPAVEESANSDVKKAETETEETDVLNIP